MTRVLCLPQVESSKHLFELVGFQCIFSSLPRFHCAECKNHFSFSLDRVIWESIAVLLSGCESSEPFRCLTEKSQANYTLISNIECPVLFWLCQRKRKRRENILNSIYTWFERKIDFEMLNHNNETVVLIQN